MTAATCTICRTKPALSGCGLCSAKVCKVCAQYIATDFFDFREKVSPDLTHGYYCAPCFDQRIEPERVKHEADMEAAKAVFVFHEGKPPPRTLLKKSNKGINVSDCLDRDETYYRLGFRALERGFNAVTNATVSRMRQRNLWEGTGIPARIDAVKQQRFED